MATILNSVNKTIEEKWAPALKDNPKKKPKNNDDLQEPNIDNLKAAVVSQI